MKMPACLLAAAALPLLVSAEPRKIVVYGMNEEALNEFRSVSPEVTVVAAAKGEEALAQAADADAIFGTITPQLFGAAKKLKWVQIYSAGVETYRFPAFIESSVTLTNCKIIQGPNIADHALALLLALTRESQPDHSQAYGAGVGARPVSTPSNSAARPRWWWVPAASARRSRSARTPSACG